MSPKYSEQPSPEELRGPEQPFSLIEPESPEFLELQQRLIEQSGCPDIEQDPEKFAEWLKKAKSLDEYLGYMGTIGKIDPYGFLQYEEGRIRDLATISKGFDRARTYSQGELIELAFAYIGQHAQTENPKLKLNLERAYDKIETRNLFDAFNPRGKNFPRGHNLENFIDLYVQADRSRLQNLIDTLRRSIAESQVTDETHGSRIKGSEPLQYRLINGELTRNDFADFTEQYGAAFEPAVEIRPLAYGLGRNDIPTQPYTEPRVSGLYGKPGTLNKRDLDIARCDQQIQILLATLHEKKYPMVVTFRSGRATVTNVETE
jgi:hypothetical protein